MRRHRALFAMALVLAASLATTAHAYQGVSLRWSSCLGDGGVINRNFACNSNTGSHLLVGSFELAQDLQQVSGNEIVIDLASASPALPSWWGFRNAGTCRQNSLTMNLVLSGAAVNCVDWANGQSAGGIAAYNIGFNGANRARFIAAAAVPQSALADLFAGQEYFSFNLLINNAKTVGTGACAGCATPVNLVFGSLKVTTPVAANDRTISGPLDGLDSNLATWQGGFPTATRRQTWGAVKALYR